MESQSIRTTKGKGQTHQDHIADRGPVAMSNYKMVHKPISILEATELVPEAKSELETQKKYNGRVVLRGDIVKDDASASHMTAATVLDVISR